MTDKQKVLKHWDEMIGWVEKQNAKGRVSLSTMYDKIKQGWDGDDCVYCRKYNNSGSDCGACPIVKTYEKDCGKLGWQKLCKAETWGEWLIYAKKLREKLEGVKED